MNSANCSGLTLHLTIMIFDISALGIVSAGQLSSITKTYNAILPEKKEADILKARVTDINNRTGTIDELMAKRFIWSRKINLLSDSMTPGVWLSEVIYDDRPASGRIKNIMPGSLVIAGYAIGAGDQGTSLIGKFIQSLQENKDFYLDIAGIDLVSTKSDKIDNQDVMSFRITCLFK